MISVRNATYCNLKGFLIYLVVLGHMIEPRIESSRELEFVYKFIYTFHMPLFAFLTGLFVKSPEGCKKQSIRLLKLYGILQLIVVLVTWGKQKLFTPYWHLWYLLSGGFWMLLAYIWFRFGKDRWKLPILICAVILGCGVGYFPWINRFLSLSRTIVFFPFFFAGILSDPERIGDKCKWGSLTMAVGAIVLFFLGWDRVPVSFLYQAEPYGELSQGWAYRLATYGIGAGISAFFLGFSLKKRTRFTKFGADTLVPYLIHGPVVLLLRELPLPWYFLPVLSFLLILFLYRGSCLVYRLYGIR